jgi:BolA protein
MGAIEARIREKLAARLCPDRLEVWNESHQHSVPEDAETHFRVLLVAEAFTGLSRVQRSRAIHEVLADELRGGVHALSLRAYDPAEWRARGERDDADSPPCFGGSKPRA